MIPASRHLVTTRPRRTTCERCARVILIGLAAGMPYRVDAIPLRLEGELDARLQGHRSYRVITDRIEHRDALDMASDTTKGRPAVCATHRCKPIDPTHIDLKHVHLFLKLSQDTEQATENEQVEQDSLFIITGKFAGARVIAIPAEDDTPPF